MASPTAHFPTQQLRRNKVTPAHGMRKREIAVEKTVSSMTFSSCVPKTSHRATLETIKTLLISQIILSLI